MKKDLKVIVRVLDTVSQSHFPIRLGDSTFRPSELRGFSFFLSFPSSFFPFDLLLISFLFSIIGSLAASCVDLPGISSLIPALLSALAESDFPRCREGSWRRAYYESIGNELYMLPTPKNLADQTFASAATAIYLKHVCVSFLISLLLCLLICPCFFLDFSCFPFLF